MFGSAKTEHVRRSGDPYCQRPNFKCEKLILCWDLGVYFHGQEPCAAILSLFGAILSAIYITLVKHIFVIHSADRHLRTHFRGPMTCYHT